MDSEYFRFVRRLTSLRAERPVLTRGGLEVLASESSGPGLLAYRREHQGDAVIVLLNSADHGILAHRLDVGVAPLQRLEVLFAEPAADAAVADGAATDAEGRLSLRLPPRAVVALRPAGEAAPLATTSVTPSAATPTGLAITVASAEIEGAVLTEDFELAGTVSQANAPLRLILDGNFDRATDFSADDRGRWRVDVPVRDLGESAHFLQVYSAQADQLSERVNYATRVTEAQASAQIEDDPDDAYGPMGGYVIPQHSESGRQREIESVRARAAGRNLELTLTMAEITTPWLPPLGFDNVALTTFFDLPGRDGATFLPRLNASAPDGMDWDLAHFARGWDSYTFRSSGSDEERQGDKLGVSPRVATDRDSRTITFFYEGAALGVDDWAGSRIYVTTWETSAEGDYIDVRPEPSEWFFGGGGLGDPKIMDDALLDLGSGPD